MERRSAFLFALFCMPLAVVLAGCGSSEDKGVTIRGKVLLDGKPLEAPQREVGLGYIEVLLVPQGVEGVEVQAGEVEEDGSFQVEGTGSGVKPGKYKLAVMQTDGPHSKMLQEKFSEKTTPITITVQEEKAGDTMDLGTIDLSKPPSSL